MYRRLLELLKTNKLRFFKEIVIMRADGVVLKTLHIIDHIPQTNNLIYVDGKRYQVTSNVFDYDLKCIKIFVGEC